MLSPFRCSRKIRGRSPKFPLGTFLVICVLLYVGVQFLIPYIKYQSLTQKMETLVNWDRDNRPAPLPGIQMLQEIGLKAEKLGIPLDEKNIRIENYDWKVIIELHYTYEVKLLPGVSFPLKFHPVRETQPLIVVDRY